MTQSIFYSSIRSPHCLKIGMVLTEKGVPFDRVEIDLRNRQQKTPAYLAINPAGQVPVYVDDGGVHADSLQIMHYLDERYPEPKLFPAEAERLRTIMDWIALSSGQARDVSHELYWQLIEPPEAGTDWVVVNELKAAGLDILAQLETALAQSRLVDQHYVCGELSAADFSLLPWIYGYGRFDLLEVGTMPNVEAWLARMTERDSFAKNFQVAGRPFEVDSR